MCSKTFPYDPPARHRFKLRHYSSQWCLRRFPERHPIGLQQHEYLELLKSSADSLLTVIDDILDFSARRPEKRRLRAVRASPEAPFVFLYGTSQFPSPRTPLPETAPPTAASGPRF